MSSSLPLIDLDKSHRLWLETAIRIAQKGNRPTRRKIKTALVGQIPDDFDPSDIDGRLLYGETQLTLLGLYQLDPQTDLIEKCDRVIRHVREMLINDSNLEQVDASVVADELNLDEEEIYELFGYIGQLHLISGGTGLPDHWGYSIISVGSNDFDRFLVYKNIQELIITPRPEPAWTLSDSRTHPMLEDMHVLQVRPIFRTRVAQPDPKLCFVLMPFSTEWSNRVYRDLIRKNVEKLGLQCLRADNLTGQIVIEDIWTKINQCGLIIADVTGRNPNVMYELGIVHAVGKPCVLITQEMSAIPFDFLHLRHYGYADNSDSFREYETKLLEIVSDVYREAYGMELTPT